MKQKIIICVLNNNGYLSIKNTQNNFFNGNYAGVDKKSGVFIPDIKKISSCFDIDYYIANDILALESILEKIKKYDGPVIVDIQCNICQEIIPTVSSKKMQDGSMVSMPLDKMYPFLSSNEELEISSLLI
jgi:acetolactate synthase-1/2/3 large subunit